MIGLSLNWRDVAVLFVLAASPVMAQGVPQTVPVQDGWTAHQSQYLDLSGSGNGPFIPLIACISANGAVGCGGSSALGNQTKAASQSVTSAGGAVLTTTQTAVPTTVISIAPVDANKVHRIVQNCSNAGGANLAIGVSAVTMATGYMLVPGASVDMSTFTGQIFAIGSAAGTACYLAN
jgi:hypothetical protein